MRLRSHLPRGKYHAGTRQSILNSPGGNLWTARDFGGNQASCHRNMLTHSNVDCWGSTSFDAVTCAAGSHPALHDPQGYNGHVIASGGCQPDTSVRVACCADGAPL